MNKDKDIKIRLSKEDEDNLNFCKEKLNTTKAAVIRMAVRELKTKLLKRGNDSMEKMYIEETTREKTGYHSIMAWDRPTLIEIMMQQITDGTDAEREAMAEKFADRIDEGEEITLGKTYISKYRIGTKEDLEAARAEKEALDKELDAMPMPSEEILKEYWSHTDKGQEETF